MYWVLLFFIANSYENSVGNVIDAPLLQQPFNTMGSTKRRCILPPYPEHGGYVVMDEPDARPGDAFDDVSLMQYKMNHDEQLIEIKNYKCTQGHWSLKIFKYESEKIYLNSSWCRLFQSEPLIDQWTAPITDKSAGNSRILQSYTQETALCTLPPEPTLGSYEVVNRPGARPGEMFEAVHLLYSCHTRKILVGNRNLYCFNNVWSSKAPSCVSCGVIPYTGNNFVSGIDATLQELPWQVALYDKGFTPFKQICGGSIIALNLVITAAHCVWNDVEKLRSALRFAVAGGKIYRDWDHPLNDYVQKSDVNEIRVPPRFRGSQTSFQDDIAILFLSTAFAFNEYVRPICLDFNPEFDARQLKPGRLGKVAGWGLISEDGKQTQKLQTGWLPNVAIDKCISDAAPDFRVYITSDKICAGYTNGSALCRGDSGGGIAFPEGEGNEPLFYLRGIVSIAPTNDKACNIYAITSFTQILAHQYFIRENLARAVF